MSRAMKKKIAFLLYDADTAIGINNEGSLVFSYNLEDTDQTAGGADIFNGQQSVFQLPNSGNHFAEFSKRVLPKTVQRCNIELCCME